MAFYQVRGKVPPKRHTIFRKDDGSIYAEEVVSTEGFSDIYSVVYHEFPPTKVLRIGKPYSVKPEVAVTENLQNRSFSGFQLLPEDDYLNSRKVLLFNDDVQLALAAPTQSMTSYFYKNARAHELLFIHEGEGALQTVFGTLPFTKGDHVIIPKGTVYQIEFNTGANRLLILESAYPFRFPNRYQNREGQLLEHAPFYERDIKTPQLEGHFTKKGEFLIKIKRGDLIFPYLYETHPFDAVGWDGHHYPYTFSIYDFEPLTGRIHQPPPVHQTFETPAFVTCAFVPRLYDYHPEAIPAPYHHSNLDSDEVLYYIDGDFMSRNNIGRGQITLHPMGLPHGPHPGAVERSIGKERTNEYAFMLDTFRPLKLTREAVELENKDYYKSWLE